jgi:hypothetical protein
MVVSRRGLLAGAAALAAQTALGRSATGGDRPPVTVHRDPT